MVGEDGGLPGGGVDVGVDLGGEDGFVAVHSLNGIKVGVALLMCKKQLCSSMK